MKNKNKKHSINFSDINIPVLSETSDYGSGTDLEFQAIQHISPQTDSSKFMFDFDERSFSCLIDETNNNSSQTRRISSSSSTSSSSSSSSTSPSSSLSNLSSLSSSSELPNNFKSNKKHLSTNNNVTSNESTICHCEKENLTNRKRNRLNSYPIRRLTTLNYCENCQNKRTKCNSRSKYYPNRQQKQRLTTRSSDQVSSPSPSSSSSMKFSVDLSGLNINYTIEYHDNLKCTYTNNLIPYYNSPLNCCKCLSINDWPLLFMMNPLNEYNHDLYYLDTNNNSWFPETINSTIFNYNNDLYSTKSSIDHRINNLSSIYFDEQTIFNNNEHLLSYYFRCMTPSIEIECEETRKTKHTIH